jgi:ubiquinone/menaquinone biosynthesis C-methylase UbiE
MPPSRQYTTAYHEQAGSYERDTAAFQPYRRAVVEALPIQSGDVVLDVGCGTGLCFDLLREKAGEVVGIEESPEMAAVARERIARAGWDNVTVIQAPAEDAHVERAADAALFCAVHDILQSPQALKNIMATLRPGARVAAGGGKWAAPVLVALNSMVSLLHAPYVRDFGGFDRPWQHLAPMVEDVQVRELAFGTGFVMTARTPA